MSRGRASVQDTPLEEWQRLHPLSPLLKGGVFFLAFLSFLLSQAWDLLMRLAGVPGYEGFDESGPAEGPRRVFELGWLVVVGIGLLVVGIVIAVAWLSWRFTRFRVAGGQLEQRVGWIIRQHRQVPLARVQAVEMSRPVLARLTGLSQVVVQSAGAGDSHLTLAFLTQARAAEVRDELLRLAGISDERVVRATPGAPPAQSQPALVQVPNGRLFVATILHGSVIILGTIALGALTAFGTLRLGPMVLLATPALIPFVFGVGVDRLKELLRNGNFVVTDLGRSLRIHHGLTELKTTMVPLHRVQAIELVQPLWWRPWGWWRVRINVAGSKIMDGDALNETVVLPVGPFEDAVRIMAVVDPELQPEALRAACLGTGSDEYWHGIPERARYLDPWGWRRRAYAVTPASLLLRRGYFRRSAVIMPHARIQSSRLHQGPVQRRLRLASVTLVSTIGPVRPVLEHLGLNDAEVLLAQESVRAGRARAQVLEASPPVEMPEVLAPRHPDSMD